MNPASKINQIRRRLLRWYDKNRRAFPWRDTQDPYTIWVIETLLQQTQVKTALPYYLRFLITYRRIRAALFFFPGYHISHLPNPDWRWVAISSLRRYPLSSLSLKAINLLNERRKIL